MYPTLGVDRALAVWGAIAIVGSPVLVIDAGTACTFTGADAQNRLFGGAILPGLRLQLQSLKQGTAALPRVDLAQHHSNVLPPRWAMDTQAAIASGILYTLVAGILDFMSDWWQQFPNSPVIMTGGDRQLLHSILIDQFPDLAGKLTLDSNLIFWGMRSVKQKIETNC
jgi:type III pantothenate kinase